MKIIYAGGSFVEARILSLSGNTMRMAVKDCDDAVGFTLSHGRWFSEQLEEVQFEFLMGREVAAIAA